MQVFTGVYRVDRCVCSGAYRVYRFLLPTLNVSLVMIVCLTESTFIGLL